MKQNNFFKILLIILALATWFALIAQFYLIILNRGVSTGETIIRFFSFFTILTNILVALSTTILLLKPKENKVNFFSRINNVTGIAVNITIVGIVFNVILRALWHTEGLQWLVNELLHVVNPLLYVTFWLFCIPKIKLNLKIVYTWMLYPLFYLLVILLLGHYSSYYPYPFIDVIKIGYKQVFINSTGMLLAFLVVTLIFIFLNRIKKS